VNEKFNIYDINQNKSIYQSDLNFKCTYVYIPNFTYEGYLNNFIFFGSQNGDTHIFNLDKLKFQNFSIKSNDIKTYSKKNKIRTQIYSDLITVKKIILHPRDFNLKFIFIDNLGIIVYDLEVKIRILTHSVFYLGNVCF
jgi:phage pi2 protein 07